MDLPARGCGDPLSITEVVMHFLYNKLWEAATICPRPCKLTFDLLTLKVVSESRMTWATSAPMLVFLDLCVLNLGPIYATDRHTDVKRASSLNASALWGEGITRHEAAHAPKPTSVFHAKFHPDRSTYWRMVAEKPFSTQNSKRPCLQPEVHAEEPIFTTLAE